MKRYILGLTFLGAFLALNANNNDYDVESCEFSLVLNDSENIVIKLENKLCEADPTTETRLFFVQNGNEYAMGKDNLLGLGQDLLAKLQLVLINKLNLDSSIKYELGYAFNELLYNNYDDILNCKNDLLVSWCCTKNRILFDYLSSWIYNYNNSIIFKITPIFCFDDSYQNGAYDQWIKNYAPFTRELSKDTVRQWYSKIFFIITTIKENVKRVDQEALNAMIENLDN